MWKTKKYNYCLFHVQKKYVIYKKMQIDFYLKEQ